ncbi:hypothetical protein Pmar_PMAR011278, partial [Perkinsus marinus ATCC 50983]
MTQPEVSPLGPTADDVTGLIVLRGLQDQSRTCALERLEFSTCRVLEQLPVDRKLHEGVPNQPRPVPNAIYAAVPFQPLSKPQT